jgi:hypothetical protein
MNQMLQIVSILMDWIENVSNAIMVTMKKVN